MYGGLKKSASRLALVAAAGVLSTGAYAADLGGDCCADLEERVAELEATTARKGNRKVSLTVSGQVNRTIMYWNDGGRSNTFWGLDNTNSSTRFGFSGSAKISPSTSAGFSILIDVADKARAVSANQLNEEGAAGFGNANGDHALRMRDANWWLEHSALGRVTVGRLTTAGGIGTIDLGGVGVVATAGEGCIGTSLLFRDANGVLTNRSIGNMSMGCAHPAFRAEGIRWNSPTFAGFTVAASIGESSNSEVLTEGGGFINAAANPVFIGRNYGVDLKYAGEFSGVRIAGAIGYERTESNDDDGISNQSNYRAIGGALSLMHVPTGLFVQGEYQRATAESQLAANAAGTNTGIYGPSRDANRWHVQAGISQNFFGIGKTNIYGEYGRHNDWFVLNTLRNNGTSWLGTVGGTNDAAATGVTSDSLRIWGLGLVQNIDAAAMELYIGYRNYKAEDGLNPALQSIDVIAAGARIKF